MTIEKQLAEARAAYHQLITGTAVRVFVDQNGERIEYVAANRNSLLAYISDLELKASGRRAHPGPLFVRF